jgi:hypothetical protein
MGAEAAWHTTCALPTCRRPVGVDRGVSAETITESALRAGVCSTSTMIELRLQPAREGDDGSCSVSWRLTIDIDEMTVRHQPGRRGQGRDALNP